MRFLRILYPIHYLLLFTIRKKDNLKWWLDLYFFIAFIIIVLFLSIRRNALLLNVLICLLACFLSSFRTYLLIINFIFKWQPKALYRISGNIWELSGISGNIWQLSGMSGNLAVKVNCLLEVALALRQLNPIHTTVFFLF